MNEQAADLTSAATPSVLRSSIGSAAARGSSASSSGKLRAAGRGVPPTVLSDGPGFPAWMTLIAETGGINGDTTLARLYRLRRFPVAAKTGLSAVDAGRAFEPHGLRA
jgi:hypothetical protein